MVRIGIVGVGGIAQNVHIKQLKTYEDVKITAICDINEETLNKVGDDLNIPAEYRFTDYNDLVNCDIVDAVEVCTPNHMHIEIATAAVKKCKPVEIEKPLALNLSDATSLAEELKNTPVPNMMCMSYRFRPAVRYAKQMMEQKLLGDIVSIDVQYLKSSAFMKGRRLDWRFVKKYAGSGVIGDLAVHLVDLATFLAGDLKKLCAHTKIVVKERKKLDSEEFAPVETEDYCSFLGELESGALANFLITRCALGNSNTIKFDIFGTNGIMSLNLNKPNEISYCIGDDVDTNAWHTETVPEEFFVEQEKTFVNLVKGIDTKYLPTIDDGIKLQKVIDAILLSAEKEEWVEL